MSLICHTCRSNAVFVTQSLHLAAILNMTFRRNYFLLGTIMKTLLNAGGPGMTNLVLGLILLGFLAGCASAPFTAATARVAAEKGDPEAEYYLARLYAKGQGVPQDYVQAVEYLRRAAGQGKAEAQNDLGAYYTQGVGVQQDYAEAVKWFRLAAAQGDPLAEYSLGLAYSYGRGAATNLTEAVKWYRRSAGQHYLEAELALGDIYLGGRGLPADHRASRQWYEKAAAQHSAMAINALGYLYERGGSGVAGDSQAAVKYYRQAAEAWDGKGQVNLGRMYLNGIGVQKDLIEAYKWFYLATQNGGGKGRHYLDELAGKASYHDFIGEPLTAEQMEEALRRAEQFEQAHRKPAGATVN